MTRNQACVLGVDVGGTKILLGYVTREGEVLESRRYAMDRSSQPSALASIEAALDGFLQLPWDAPPPLGLGIGVVGQTDPATGTWVEAMNIPIGTPVPLGARLQARYGLPVALDNDVHAATLAELRLGAGRGAADFIYLNVGTGLAAGIVCNGRLVRGAANYAGELGHWAVEPEGEVCQCGQRGCLEPIASGGGIIAQAQAGLRNHPDSLLHEAERAGELTAGAVFTAAEAGDALAGAVAGRALRGLGAALVGLVNLLNPEVIVLGGGVLAGGWLLPRLEAHVARYALPGARSSLRGLFLSTLRTELVGLLGAASLAWEECGEGAG